MEWEWSYVFFSAIIILPAFILFFSQKNTTKSSYKFPPGPPGLPIFGNMFELGTEPYKKMAVLRQKYGPVLWLKLGSTYTMVVQTAQASEELFKNHDISFANRVIPDVNQAHSYYQGSLAIAPYGPFWRFQRRICTIEMFVHKKISETEPVRRKCVDNMLKWIEKEANSAEKGSGIEVTRFVFLASFNMLGNLILSKDLADLESEEASEFFIAMKRINEWSGIANVSDIFPFLKKFDLQSLRKKMARDMGKAVEIMSMFLKEREEERKKGTEKGKDFLDVLLEFQGTGKDEPAKLSEHEIKIFVLEMFLAGTETTSSSVEWALTELLRHPEAMAKVKTEISQAIEPNRKFEDSDIENLPYMQAVLKESLRLHPPLPFLIPRETIQDTKFMGYDVPKDTQVLVNAWAIGRDPECWDDPMSFKPERFLGSKIDVKGQHYGLIPFGAGRRMCVGLPLGHRMMHFALGSLLREFEWELPDGVSPKSINMDGSMGVTARKRDSLKVIPKKA
uniref:Cytochrome P450 76A2 n=1 Tax=Solanum melongena TaxID=223891 RepID=C76A2_SOLME|nr:RecName: Full=Cytochrome P450 76A2; AltName: Full=CYPLXXVIA2; AltName: Full=Cytochrome P-450EG7 [Solanum melongena]CAA50648.1 P450 hydroxylase [Solanum melongena]